MNQLSPDAYSIANLSLSQIFQNLAIRITDPQILWRALHKESAFGSDYFFQIIEKEYSNRINGNMEPLKQEINQIKIQFKDDYENFIDTANNYMESMKKELNDKTL